MFRVLILILILLMLVKYIVRENYNEDNVCRGMLTDEQYLNHMIAHHQVAVDISIMLQKNTKSPVMQEIIRKLIWMQNYEINLMKIALRNLPSNDMSIETGMNKKYIPTISDYMEPNKLGLTKTYCDPYFFNPEEHMKHMRHMKLDDEMYIKHMIPHHQVAVDMSKVLLKNTTNDFMIHLAYRIIRSQQGEVIILDNLNKMSKYKHSSELLI